MKRTLRLIEDVLPAGAEPVFLPSGPRGLLVLEGSLTIETEASNQHLPAQIAWVGSEEIAYIVGPEPVRLLRWEVVAAEPVHDGRLRSAPKAKSRVLLSSAVDLDAANRWLLRVDRVTFPKGTAAPLHVHQGPGIRCVLKGEIDHLGPDGTRHLYKAGEPFHEDGIDAPIWAGMSATEETQFVRGLLLPRAVKGRGSTRFVNPQEWSNPPRFQSYHVYAERFIDL